MKSKTINIIMYALFICYFGMAFLAFLMDKPPEKIAFCIFLGLFFFIMSSGFVEILFPMSTTTVTTITNPLTIPAETLLIAFEATRPDLPPDQRAIWAGTAAAVFLDQLNQANTKG